MIRMYDSVEIDQIPNDAEAVAGYVGGSWPTFAALSEKFPHAHRLSIAVNAGEDADCLDIESGDAVPSQAAAWVQRQIARGVWRPCLYSNLSVMPAVIADLKAAGIPRSKVRLWLAHYTGTPHIEPGYDACQWTDRSLGRNLDESLCLDSFFQPKAAAPPAPRPDPHHYMWFDVRERKLGKHRKGNERSIVVEYDHKRAHWRLYPRRLRRLRDDMSVLAARLETVMHDDPAGNEHEMRQWRHDQLVGRSSGRRYV